METFMTALGHELRAARKHNGWTRKDLQRHLPFDVSLQTLATWELGTRHISAERLVEVANALGEPAENLLARVRRSTADPVKPELSLDVAAAARTPRARLAPVRAWAKCRLRDHPGAQRVVKLDIPALDRLAEICEMSTLDLTNRLTHAGLIQPRPQPRTPTHKMKRDAL